MKLRTGFVSNSSSSSFCLYGVVFWQEEYEIDCALFRFQEETQKKLKHVVVESPPETGRSYLGVEYCNMEENETKAEFKSRVASYIKEFNDWLKNNIANLALLDIECGTHSEAWYDG